jgi:hypothetical protein
LLPLAKPRCVSECRLCFISDRELTALEQVQGLRRMNPPIRTIVTFQSTKFNTSKPVEPPLPPGDFGADVCKWMIGKLTDAGIRSEGPYAEGPCGPCDWLKNDRGVWAITFSIGKQKYEFDCGFRLAVKDKPAMWVAHVSRSLPEDLVSKLLWATVFRDKLEEVDPAATDAIHTVLSGDPAISNIRWHCLAGFVSGHEEDAANAP